MRSRARWYADEIQRVSIARLKLDLGPARWRGTKVVHLDADGHEADVPLLDLPAATTFGGTRRFLQCPRCGGRAQVLGVVPGVGWCCASCGGWKGRAAVRARLLPEGGEATYCTPGR